MIQHVCQNKWCLTQDFRSGPSVGVLVPRLRRHSDGDESDDEGGDVGQHVERVRHQRHRVGHVTDHDFDLRTML
jgi:hypothetical protein